MNKNIVLILMHPNSSICLLQDIVLTHPGLSFLGEKFHINYISTVSMYNKIILSIT